MITLKLHCSAVKVHPSHTDPPIKVDVVDVEPEEVIQQLEVADIIKIIGPQALLNGISIDDIKEHLNP
jgi:hypothetical protein